jgi:NAD(P)-dependent dehydrogenase (short-subunit alcohol dehydrogenase family)
MFNDFDKSTIPDLSGRVILITGGTGGIGVEIVDELAKHNPAHIIFTGRNAASADTTIKRAHALTPHANITFIPCDLASLASVNAAADKVIATCPRLDVFLPNAGIMATPPGLSEDGYEVQFATNHLGHALLTRRLLPLLEKTAAIPGADVRLIITSSTGWHGGTMQFDDLRTTKDTRIAMGRWKRYCDTKLANMLYARELAKRYPKILCFSLSPGVVGTSLVTDLSLFDRTFVYVTQLGRIRTVEQGSYNHLWALSVPRESIKAGEFYEPVGKLSTYENASSKDPEMKGRLWEWTEKELEKWLK